MDIKETIEKRAKEAGAETKADFGIFLVGGAAGGLVDAALNSFGFAEPLLVATLTGSGAVGLKKWLWDSTHEGRWRKTS